MKEISVTVILDQINLEDYKVIDGSFIQVKENYDKSRRIHRGLFVGNNGIQINADVNGAYQILKKVIPNAFANPSPKLWLVPDWSAFPSCIRDSMV